MTLARFSNQFPTLFDRFFDNDYFDWSNRNFSHTNTTLPSVNIMENNDGFDVEMAAPGLDKNDFMIELNQGVLTISSEKSITNDQKDGEQFTRREFSYQSFSRSFTLPENVDSDKIKEKYENGLLRVHIPKREEAKPKPARAINIS